MRPIILDGDRLLTRPEVAALFRVSPKTVTRWAIDGALTTVRTPGGHRRYLESEVLARLQAQGVTFARAASAEGVPA